MKYTEEKGYLEVTLNGKKKWAHLGMNALKVLQDDFGITLKDLGASMSSEDPYERIGAFSDLLYAGFKSFDLQNNNNIDYNRATTLEEALMWDDVDVRKFTKVLTYVNGVDYLMRTRMGKKELTESQQ